MNENCFYASVRVWYRSGRSEDFYSVYVVPSRNGSYEIFNQDGQLIVVLMRTAIDMVKMRPFVVVKQNPDFNEDDEHDVGTDTAVLSASESA